MKIIPLSGFVKKPPNESPSTIQRESVIEQSRISAESWNFNVNDRQGGKREKLSLGNKAEDHSCFGLKAFSAGKNFRGQKMTLCFQLTLALLLSLLIFACLRQNAHANASRRLASEQRMATGKYLSTQETALTIRFFDDRKLPENALQLWGKGIEALPNR